MNYIAAFIAARRAPVLYFRQGYVIVQIVQICVPKQKDYIKIYILYLIHCGKDAFYKLIAIFPFH